MLDVRQREQLEHLVHSLQRLFAGTEPMEKSLEKQVLMSCKVIVDPRSLARVSNEFTYLIRLGLGIEAVDSSPTRSLSQQCHKYPDRRGLAGTVRSEQAEYLTGSHDKRQFFKCNSTSRIDLCEILYLDCGSCGASFADRYRVHLDHAFPCDMLFSCCNGRLPIL